MRLPSFLASPATAVVLAFLQAGWALMLADLPATCPPGQIARILTDYAVLEALVTLVLGISLLGAAHRRGHAGGWSAMALLSLIGVVVVYCLPHRMSQPGFPIEPNQP